MTLRHIVCWKLVAQDPAGKAEAAATIADLLGSLPAHIDEIRSLEVGRDVVGSATAWDLVLVADYDDAEALQRYQDHPEHQRVAATIRELTADRAVVDYEV